MTQTMDVLSPGQFTGDLELADLIDLNAIQSLVDTFFELAHIPMAIIDLKGKVLVGAGWQDVCTQFHRVNPASCANCLESDTQLSAGVCPGEFKLYKCRNNMWDIATPIMVGGRHVGNLFSGQFFFDDEEPDYELFRLQAKEFGFDEQEYISALNRVPRLSRASVNSGMLFFLKLAHLVSQIGFSNNKLARLLSEKDSLMHSLVESEERYRTLVELSPQAIFIDRGGLISLANPAAAQLLGAQSPRQLLGKPVLDFFHPDYHDEVRERIGRLSAGESVHPVEQKIIRMDGSVIDVEVSAAPHFARGERAIQVIMKDISERRQVEETLRRYEMLAAQTRDIILFVRREDGRILEANAAAVKAYGYDRDTLLSLTVYDLRVDSRKLASEQLARADAEGLLFETTHRRRDGSTFPVEVSSRGATIGNSRILVSVIRDITERKLAEEALRKARDELELRVEERTSELLRATVTLREQAALLDLAHDAIMVRSMDQRITFWNKGAEEIYGFSKKEALNSMPHILLKTRSPVAIDQIMRRVLEEGRWSGEIIHVRSNGEEIVVESRWALQTGRDGEPVGFLEINRDITLKKKAEEALESYMERLQLTNQELQEFASVASHDLQEPLRKIQIFGERLRSRCAEGIDEVSKDYLIRMEKSANRMQDLVRDLLRYSRVAVKPVPFRELDLNEVVKEVVQILEFEVRRRKGKIKLSALPTIDADPTQMKQMFQNLLGNALKFQRDNEPPVVKVTGKIQGGFCRIIVEDNGIGFDEKYLDRIFAPFQRLHGHKKYEGTGIGLSICRKVAERHGGTITAKSRTGKGTKFVVILPVKQRA